MEPSPDLFPSKAEFVKLIAVIAIASLVAFGCNFLVTIFSREPKPFCDENADFEDSFHDICDPCPSNGECYQGKLECAHGYRKYGKSCIEDGNLNEKAKKLSELVEYHVCEAYAQFMCGGVGAAWLHEDEIWNDLDEAKLMENLGLENSTFMLAKRKAAEAVGKVLETRTQFTGKKEVKCPDFLAERFKPFTCQIRLWMSRHVLALVFACTLIVGCLLLFKRLHRKWYLSARAEELYNQVCDILEENALLSKDVNNEGDTWVAASWLRDHLLSPSERKDPALWRRVEEFVQEDSRLHMYPKLVRGEPKVVWEWQVEGSLSSSTVRKRRAARKFESREISHMNFNDQYPMQETKSGATAVVQMHHSRVL